MDYFLFFLLSAMTHIGSVYVFHGFFRALVVVAWATLSRSNNPLVWVELLPLLGLLQTYYAYNNDHAAYEAQKHRDESGIWLDNADYYLRRGTQPR